MYSEDINKMQTDFPTNGVFRQSAITPSQISLMELVARTVNS